MDKFPIMRKVQWRTAGWIQLFAVVITGLVFIITADTLIIFVVADCQSVITAGKTQSDIQARAVINKVYAVRSLP